MIIFVGCLFSKLISFFCSHTCFIQLQKFLNLTMVNESSFPKNKCIIPPHIFLNWDTFFLIPFNNLINSASSVLGCIYNNRRIWAGSCDYFCRLSVLQVENIFLFTCLCFLQLKNKKIPNSTLANESFFPKNKCKISAYIF